MFQNPSDLGPGSIDALAASIQGLPWAAHWVAVAAVVAGLLLWGVGRQVVKPLFCLIGGIGGGIAGFLLASMTGVDAVGTVPSPMLGLGIGGLLGLCIAASLFNFAVAVGFAVVAGISGILVSATVLELQNEARSALDATIAVHSQNMAGFDSERAAILHQPREGLGAGAAASLTGRARELAWGLGGELQSRWGTLDPRSQFIVGLSALGGAGVGFLIGLLLPHRSAAAATALLGSAVWLTGGVWLAGALDAPGREFLDRGPKEWLIVWLGVAGLGLAMQLQGMSRHKSIE